MNLMDRSCRQATQEQVGTLNVSFHKRLTFSTDNYFTNNRNVKSSRGLSSRVFTVGLMFIW
jgi:hypothetical protein